MSRTIIIVGRISTFAMLSTAVYAQPTQAIRPPTLGAPVAPRIRLEKPLASKGTLGAAVEGDLYFVAADGVTKRGAGQAVWLLLDLPSLKDSLGTSCRGWQDAAGQISRAAYENNRSIAQAQAQSIGDPEHLRRLLDERRSLQRRTADLQNSFGRRLRELLEDFHVDDAVADVNGHFRFTGLRPGPYMLFADWKVDTTTHQWWSKVRLFAGETRKKDLDVSSQVEPSRLCSDV